MNRLRKLCTSALLGLGLVAGIAVTAQPALAETVIIVEDEEGNIICVLILPD